jgi:hypothetical protein
LDKALVEVAERLTPLIVERDEHLPAPLQPDEDWPPAYRAAMDVLDAEEAG